jgi:hypothetical protein
MTRRICVSRIAVALATAALTVAGLLLVAAAPASAAAKISFTVGDASVSGGGTTHEAGAISVSARYSVGHVGSGHANLTVTDPSGARHEAGSRKRCDTLQSCHDAVSLRWGTTSTHRNGKWLVQLTSTDGSASATFTVAAPPRQVGTLTVARNGSSKAALHWPTNTEPDLTGYALVDGADHSKVYDVGNPGDLCESGACSAPITRSGSYAIAAVRSCPAGCGSTKTVVGATSNDIDVTVPVPSPTASDGTSHSGGAAFGSPSPSASGKHAKATKHHTGKPESGKHGKSKTGKAKHGKGKHGAKSQQHSAGGFVPAFSPLFQTQLFAEPQTKPAPRAAGQAPRTAPAPGTTEGPNGPYSSTLDYGEHTIVTKTPVKQHRLTGRTLGVSNTVLWPFIAGALLLMLAGAHLRAWLSSKGDG